MTDAPLPADPVIARNWQRWLALGAGVLLLVATAVNAVATYGFPGNAPVEWVMSAFISFSLFCGAVPFIVLVFVWRHRKVPVARVSVWSILAIGFAGLALLGWLVTTGVARISAEPLRYMHDAGWPLFSSWPWLFAMVAAVVGLRRGSGAVNAVLGWAGLAAGALMMVTALVPAILYGMGIGD